MSQVAKVFELQLQHQSFQWTLLFSCSVMFNSLWSMGCSMPGYPVLHYLLEFAQAHVHWVGDVHSPGSTASNEHSGLISFRIDWFDLVAIRGTLKSLLYHHSSKATIFQCSAIFGSYGPNLASVHDCLKKQIFDFTDICYQSKVKENESHSAVSDSLQPHTIHGILEARILESVLIPFSRGSSLPRDQTQVSHNAGWFFTSWFIRETQEYWSG